MKSKARPHLRPSAANFAADFKRIILTLLKCFDYKIRPVTRKDVVPLARFRHEWKHEINAADCLALRARLRAVASPDEHAPGGRYLIRSLYFDDWVDSALREKVDGVDRREKFRIRYYNGDAAFLRLEKKSKLSGLCAKDSIPLTAEEAQSIVDGRWDWMAGSGRPLLQELYHKMKCRGLRPRTIVDYTREAFVYAPGNVRVTIDRDIRTGLSCTDFLDPGCPTVPVPGAPAILEVKWDAFLPDAIRGAVGLEGRHACAFSKYAACRMYD
ncbi:MAG: polyphosphate polymerase domain-containing protein [Clostridiales bacterium]|nr:polyphosphate polymerase domain-containing protein [Clostridiales bacterium]